jgi:DNA replication initiation complex subunit (GINS family)
MVEVKITYETLFDLLRREKSRGELQVLDKSFYQDVIAYLKEKKGMLREEDHQTLIFSKGEQEKIRIQIKNIHKLLRELYEVREKKVINLAMNRVRTGSNLIDTSALLPEERSLYNETCELLTKYTEGVLSNVLRMELPVMELKETEEDTELTDKNAKQKVFDHDRAEKENEDKEVKAPEPVKVKEYDYPKNETTSSTNEKLVRVKILNDLPKFLGQDKNIYGPYKKEDLVELPEIVANILLKKGRIELI